jgi:Flp pilus assembly protein TadG
MSRRLDVEALRARPVSRTTKGRRRLRHDESGTALVELALVLPLVILLLGAAFNGWNGMQSTIRLTSAARAGAIVAANDLTSNSTHPATTTNQALVDATNSINQEEGTTNLYQSTDASANNYVSMSESTQNIATGVTMSVVTVTISHASVSFVPFVGSFPVTTHATARYS